MKNVKSLFSDLSHVGLKSDFDVTFIRHLKHQNPFVKELDQFVTCVGCEVKFCFKTSRFIDSSYFPLNGTANMTGLDLSDGHMHEWKRDLAITVVIPDGVTLFEFLFNTKAKYYTFLRAKNRYEYIRELNLSGNELTTFHCYPFRDLHHLLVLNLSNNKIGRIKSSLFVNVKKLEFIDISFNLIEQLDAEAFEGLLHLEILDVSFNPLRKIHRDTFLWNTCLHELDLSNNPLPENCIATMTGLARLRYILALSLICKFDWGRYNLIGEQKMMHKTRLNATLFVQISPRNGILRRSRDSEIHTEVTRKHFYENLLDADINYETYRLLALPLELRFLPRVKDIGQEDEPLNYLVILNGPFVQDLAKTFQSWSEFINSVANRRSQRIHLFDNNSFYVVSSEV